MSGSPDISDFVKAGDPTCNTVMFSWEVIDVCQYNCTYCSAVNFNVNTFKQQPHLKTAWKLFIDKLSMKSMRLPFTVELLGGEPTLHPDIYKIIDSLCINTNCQQVELITNLAKPLTFFERFNKPENNKLVIQPSFHPEYYNEDFVNKTIKINEWEHANVMCNINLSDDPTQWEKTRMVIDRLTSANVPFYINFLFEVPSGKVEGWKPKYTEQFFTYFHEYLTPDTEGDSHLKAPCRLNESGNLTLDDNTGDISLASTYLNKHAATGETSIEYIDKKNNKTLLTNRDIIKHDLAQFTGWSCTPLMYGVTMAGEVFNHCTNETIPIYNMNNKGLSKCVECPLDRCDCDTKFQYYKERVND